MARERGSTIVRKPGAWGGHLEGTPRARRRSGPDPLDTVGLLLRKFTELCLLSTILAVPFIYHLNVSAEPVNRIGAMLGNGVLYLNNVRPYLTGLMPVLESKFSCWLVCGTLMIVGYLTTQILQAFTGRRFFRQAGLDDGSSRRTPYRFVPLLCIGLYLVFSLASMLLWPPAAPPEALATAAALTAGPKGTQPEVLGGGGFFFSAVSWLQLAFGLVFLLVAEDTIRERSFVNKMLGLMLFAGFANALTVLLQKVHFAPLMAIWFDFPASETRNNLGAFIGHNTGLSSFLIAPFLIALTWLASIQPRKSRTFRLAMGLAVLTMAMALVLAQSRAVLPILAACVVAIFLVLRQRACLLPKSRLYIGLPVAMAFVVLTQLVPARFNPFYREDVTLVKRVQEFRPSRLVTETRLRILFVCVTQLLQDTRDVAVGHGFGSFQYVYPRAQGEYFRQNPRTLLAPTPLRTPQAHNEYLQTLVETGFVGLGIAVTGLVVLLRGGWLVLKRSLMPHHIAAETAVYFAALGMLAHCATDFPLRIPPLALYIVLLLAIMSAGDRLWLFPSKTPLTEEELATNAPAPTPPFIGANLAPGAWASLGIALFVLMLVGAVAAGRVTFNSFQSCATLQNRAESYLTASGDPSLRPQDKSRLMEEAYKDLEAAKRIFWLSGPVNMSHGRAVFLYAYNGRLQVDSLMRAGNKADAQKVATNVYNQCMASLSDLNLGLMEERYHHVYRLRSMVYQMLADFSPSPKREEYSGLANDDLYRAVDMNPGDPEALLALIQKLEMNPQTNRDAIIEYLRKLNYFHEDFFWKRVYSRVLDGMALGEMKDARARMQVIFEAVPENLDFRLAWTQLCLHVGDVDTARSLLAGIEQTQFPPDKARIYSETLLITQLHLWLLTGSYEVALKRLEGEQFEYVPPAQVKAYEMLICRAMKKEPARTEQLREELIQLGKENAINYQIAGSTALRFFNDADEAIYWLEKRHAVTDPPMDLQGAVLLADAYSRANRPEDARKMIPEIRGRGDTPYAVELGMRIADRLEQTAAPEAAPK